MERAMDNDPNQFRNYAVECSRLAERASETDKAVLMEIAAAWLACAEQMDRTTHQSVHPQDKISPS